MNLNLRGQAVTRVCFDAALTVLTSGDYELRVETEILEIRPSKSLPQQGRIKARVKTLNQDGEAVQNFVANLIVPRRAA